MTWAHRIEMSRIGEFLAVGIRGWCYWRVAPFRHDVRVEVVENPTSRLSIHALRIEAFDFYRSGHGYVGPADLRELPLGRIGDLINSPRCSAIVRAGLVASDEPDFSPEGCGKDDVHERALALPLLELRREFRIEIPEGRSRDDSFYKLVADTYAMASQESHRPAVEIAKASDVNVTTVHRWIKEARRRGVLSPAKP